MPSRVFDTDDLLRAKEFASRVPFSLSADGRCLAVTVMQLRKAKPGGRTHFSEAGVSVEVEGSRVLLVDTASGQATEPFADANTSWAPQWSPDGRLLAAYVQYGSQHACLGIWDRDGRAARALTSVLVRPFFGFEVPAWLPDNRGLVVKLAPAASRMCTPEAAASGEPGWSVFSFDPQHHSGADVKAEMDRAFHFCLGDLAVVDVFSAQTRRLAEGWAFRAWRVAPDGRRLAVERLIDCDASRQQLYYDLMAIPVHGDPPRRLVHRLPEDYGVCFNWSPDGQRIAWLTLDQGRSRGLRVVDVDEPRHRLELTTGNELGEHHDEWDWPPLWAPDGQTVYVRTSGIWAFGLDGSAPRHLAPSLKRHLSRWVQDAGSAVLQTPPDGTVLFTTWAERTKCQGLARISLTTGEAQPLQEFAHAWGGEHHHQAGVCGRTPLYLAAHRSDRLPEVWRVDAVSGTVAPVFSLHRGLADVALGTCQLIDYRAEQHVGKHGTRRQAAIMLPPGCPPGQPLPTLFVVYPGASQSRLLHRFGFEGSDFLNAHLFASRGYLAVYPDLLLHPRDPLKQLAGEVVPLVDRLVGVGLADRHRLGVIGHSFGGYGVLGLITQTDAFRAAVASAATVNLTSYATISDDGYADVGWFEHGQAGCDGTPWQRREAYIENSPLFFLDRVRTALLVVAGTADAREAMQARQTFGALRRLGRKVELRLYHGEDHWPGSWSEPSFHDLCARMLAWFDEHLQPPPSP